MGAPNTSESELTYPGWILLTERVDLLEYSNTTMQPYDPLDYENLASSVVDALMNRHEADLPPRDPFAGAGVYALFYNGDLPVYRPLVGETNRSPVYVGKAVPPGGRKGVGAKGTSSDARSLYLRLKQHAGSIDQAENLRIEDFSCRYLVVVPVWISLAERVLVERYQPLWNVVVDGFGNHDPGKGRSAMRKPQWDILHPGRPWAASLNAHESVDDVISRIESFLTREH